LSTIYSFLAKLAHNVPIVCGLKARISKPLDLQGWQTVAE